MGKKILEYKNKVGVGTGIILKPGTLKARKQAFERKADEEIRTLDPLLGKEMLYH